MLGLQQWTQGRAAGRKGSSERKRKIKQGRGGGRGEGKKK